MKKGLLLSIALAGLLLFSTTTSQAGILLPTIGFDPASQVVPVGDTVDVDLFISGLGDYAAPSLSTFDLDITYDPTILAFDHYLLGPYLGDISNGEALDWSWGETIPGSVNICELSLLFEWELDALQPSSFTLATLTFDTLAVGTSSLDIGINALGDAWGGPLTADVQSGSVAPVPEPATLLLLGSGVAGIFGLGRKRWL